jgi:hypothetical protein
MGSSGNRVGRAPWQLCSGRGGSGRCATWSSTGAILGLTAPWTVASVDLDVKGQRVVVRVEAGPGPYPCPECGTATARYDSKPRRWRHLDTMQFMTCSS